MSAPSPCRHAASAKLRRLLLRDPFVRPCMLGELGGSLCSRDGCRFGEGRKGSSPGTMSSVRPDLAFGARARTAPGTCGRSKLYLPSMNDLGDETTSSDGRPPC